MARKPATQAAEDQIKDQAFSELQSLIEESEKLLKSSASLVGEEAETLRGQIALKLQQARDSVSSVRDRTLPAAPLGGCGEQGRDQGLWVSSHD